MSEDLPAIPFDYGAIWPKLRHDEKRLLLVMAAIYPIDAAVKYIGKDKHWLYRTRSKPHVKSAIEARNSDNNTEILNLVLDDMAYMTLVSASTQPTAKEMSKNISKKKLMESIIRMESLR